MNTRVPPAPAGLTEFPTLVLIHDAHGSQREFASLVQILGARQVAVDFLAIPGYTHECGRPALSWRTWLRAASEALDRRHGAGARIVLGGLGTGGALAAALALEQRPQQVCGLALLAATFTRVATTVDSPWARIASLVGLDRWVSMPQREPFGVKNPKSHKWIARELEEHGISAVGPARMPLRALRESDRLHAHVRTALTSLPSALPLLALHATDDDVADVAGIAALVERLGDRARLIALAHSHHRITVDNDRQRVAHELADFVGAPKFAAADKPAATPTRPTPARVRRPAPNYAPA